MPRFLTNGDGGGYNYDFPLGIAYISATLKRAGHQVHCLNLNHEKGSVDALVGQAIEVFGPDVCGCGGLTPHYEGIEAVFRASRRANPDIINLIGGGVFSSAPEIVADMLDINVGVIGEGENAVIELAEAIDSGQGFDHIPGLLLRQPDGTKARTPERKVFKQIDQLPWPDLDGFGVEDLFSNQLPVDNLLFNFEDEPRCVPMIASRSCPFSCTFCFHPNGRVYRERSLEDFFAELDDRIERYGINLVTILDELFAVKKKRLVEFCAWMKDRPVKWMVQLHVSVVDDEVLRLMRESGCVVIGFGLESMSPEVLESMEKKATPQQIEDALMLARKHNIGLIGNFLFGDPADSEANVNETVDWWARHRHYQLSLVSLKVFPGSPLWQRAVAEGRFKTEADSIRSPFINMTRFSDDSKSHLLEMLQFFQRTAMVPAALNSVTVDGRHPSRGDLACFDWNCPSCGHRNRHHGVPLGFLQAFGMATLACRDCGGQFDLPVPRFPAAPDPEAEAARASAADLVKRAEADGDGTLFQKAAEAYRALIMEKPWDAVFASEPLRQAVSEFADLCEIHFQNGRMTVTSLGAALSLNPWNVRNQARFARALMNEGMIGAAMLYFRTASKLSENNFQVPDAELSELLDQAGQGAPPPFVLLQDQEAVPAHM